MGELQTVNNLVKETVTEIYQHTSYDELWQIFNVHSALILNNYYLTPGAAIDTLIQLLSDTDNRVIIFALLYLGQLKGILSLEHKKQAIEAIHNTALRSSDNFVGIAASLANAMLGKHEAVEWMMQEMKKHNTSDIILYQKSLQISIIRWIIE